MARARSSSKKSSQPERSNAALGHKQLHRFPTLEEIQSEQEGLGAPTNFAFAVLRNHIEKRLTDLLIDVTEIGGIAGALSKSPLKKAIDQFGPELLLVAFDRLSPEHAGCRYRHAPCCRWQS